MAKQAENTATKSMLDFSLLASNKKETAKRILFANISAMIGDKGRVEISPESKYSDRQKMLDIITNNGDKFAICCEYKLSKMIHNEVVSMKDLGAMEVCQVPLLSEGPDKGKLVWKVLLPESWSEKISISASEMKKAEDVAKVSLYSPDQLASW